MEKHDDEEKLFSDGSKDPVSGYLYEHLRHEVVRLPPWTWCSRSQAPATCVIHGLNTSDATSGLTDQERHQISLSKSAAGSTLSVISMIIIDHNDR
ncbi:hypothetical protein AHX13_23265 [Salmonella enterica subsp. enterica serovar Newport]|nr:hypothetical protein [Salmonella enterica subsp. enterica serovar Newport]